MDSFVMEVSLVFLGLSVELIVSPMKLLALWGLRISLPTAISLSFSDNLSGLWPVPAEVSEISFPSLLLLIDLFTSYNALLRDWLPLLLFGVELSLESDLWIERSLEAVGFISGSLLPASALAADFSLGSILEEASLEPAVVYLLMETSWS